VVVTGRVLLHALDSDERPLCGQDHTQLTPIGGFSHPLTIATEV
jgi:hypothetical protein